MAGGRDILSAANDVGQILFQSAAGIASFGAVREALEEEAASLWAKRRAGDREYFIAADELARAQETLKQVTVRQRDWVAARDEVERLQRDAAETRARYEALAQRRARLERVRRVAPVLAGLCEREAAFEALGPVKRLAADAARQLDEAERVMALAAQARQLHETQAAELAEALARISPNTGLLARDQDIEALAAQRHQVRNHPADVAKRQEEARAHWKTLEGLARELGWPAQTEETLAARIPSQVDRAAAGALVRRHDTLAQAVENANEAQAVKRGEVTQLDQSLARLPETELPPSWSQPWMLREPWATCPPRSGVWRARWSEQSGSLPTPARPSVPGRRTWTFCAVCTYRAATSSTPCGRTVAGSNPRPRASPSASMRNGPPSPTWTLRSPSTRPRTTRCPWRTWPPPGRPATASGKRSARALNTWHSRDPYEGLVGEADALADRRHDKAQEAATLQSSAMGASAAPAS